MAEGKTQAAAPRYYSIVVAGAMNPRIHVPLWYKLIDCITEGELKESKDVAVLTQLAHFTVVGISITCTEDRWEVSTLQEQLRPRTLEIAVKVFDKLQDTPVTAIGINTIGEYETASPNVAQDLAKIGQATGFAPSRGEVAGCTITIGSTEPYRKTQVIVEPSKLRENMVHINYNTHLEIKGPKGYVDTAPIFRENFDPHFQEVKEFAEKAVAKFAPANVPAKE